jgi:hypothetical protein
MWENVFNLAGVIIRVDFVQRLRQFEVDVIQAHLPLLDPTSHLDALVAALPFLGFRVECLSGRLGDAAGKGPCPFQDLIVVVHRCMNRLGKRLDCLIERDDGAVQRFSLLAKVSRQGVPFHQLLLANFECHRLSLQAPPVHG